MNLEKIKELNNALDTLATITEKLDFYKKNYLDKYPGDSLWNYFELKTKEDLGTTYGDGLSGYLWLPISGETGTLITSLETPNNGASLEFRIEYHYWMLQYRAEKLFNDTFQPYYSKEILKPLGEKLLTGKINGIKKIQQNADILLNEDEFNLYQKKDITPEKLYLWFVNDYYKEFIEWTNEYESHVENICTYKHTLPFLQQLVAKRDEFLNPELFNVINIDIKGLVKKLKEEKYLQESNCENLTDWFYGKPTKRKIKIEKYANQFVSVIASLIDAEHITNGKEFCAKYIYNNVLFKNKQKTYPYIFKLMEKENPLRITLTTDPRFFDITSYIKMNEESTLQKKTEKN